MIRVVLATVLGGLIAFVWFFGFVMFLPWHEHEKKRLDSESEQKVFDAFGENGAKKGVYLLPAIPDDYFKLDAEEQMAWEKRIHKGPVTLVYHVPDGVNSLSPWFFVRALGITFLGALIASCLLYSARTSLPAYYQRLLFVGVLGLFAGIPTHMTMWYLGFLPLELALGQTVELFMGWILAGLVIAALVKKVSASSGGEHS